MGHTLLLQDRGYGWILDSSQALAAEGRPSIGYATLCSNIEHKDRITLFVLKYILDFRRRWDLSPRITRSPGISPHRNWWMKMHSVRQASLPLLDPEFLPKGGTLALRLRQIYHPKRTRRSHHKLIVSVPQLYFTVCCTSLSSIQSISLT